MSDKLEARLDVRDLICRYSDAVTRRDFDCVAGLFATDAVWKTGEPFNMQFDGPAIGPSLGGAVGSFTMFMQMSFQSVIDLRDDGSRATARTLVAEMGNTPDGGSFVQFGIYEDAMAKINGKWQFTLRIFHPTYRDESKLTGMPFPFQMAGLS